MKLYKEFEEALQEVAENADETPEFNGRFQKMVTNFMNGMNGLSNIDDIIQNAMKPREKTEN